MFHTRNILALIFPLLLCACATQALKTDAKKSETFLLRPASYQALPGWRVDHQHEALTAFLKSCTALKKKDPDESMRGFAGTAGDWQQVCDKTGTLLLATDDEARQFFEANFTPYAVYGAKGTEGLFTGYYEPELHGSYEKKDPYLTPLYGRPADMLTVNLGDFAPDLKGKTITGRVDGDKFVPYYSRADIEKGALTEQKKEIVWVDNAVDAFFLHIQGSGVVTMQDGSVLHVGYAAQNGRPYLAIGKALIESGALTKDNVSMQSIRAWLEANPKQAPEVMNLNQSYVFFRALEGEGPLGAEGVALTPTRSLAVDHNHIPYGAPFWLDAQAPEGEGRLQRLMVAQDTGGAIGGSVRGDFFWGAGAQAANDAGVMNSKGAYYILLPRAVAVPPAYQWRWWRATGGAAAPIGMKRLNP